MRLAAASRAALFYLTYSSPASFSSNSSLTAAAFVACSCSRTSQHVHIKSSSAHHFFWSRNKSKMSTPTTEPTAAEPLISNGSNEAQGSADASTTKLERDMTSLDLSSITRFANKNADALFGYIEKCQVESSPSPNFGRFLDAGTGSHSLRWMASVFHREQLLQQTNHGDDAAPLISMESFTAITADETMRRRVVEEAQSLGIADKGEVVIGNWSSGVERTGKLEYGQNKLLLEGQQFDTILVDYLVGAIDGFAPYFQDLVFERLMPHLAEGGRMYIIGLQPIPDRVPSDANVMCKITKIRDACILLANHRCYREYPVDWIQRHIKRAGMDVLETRQYPIRYDHGTMLKQINVGRSKLRLFPTRGLANEMAGVLDRLEQESLEVTRKQENGRITLGFDYVVVAEKKKDGEGNEDGKDGKNDDES